MFLGAILVGAVAILFLVGSAIYPGLVSWLGEAARDPLAKVGVPIAVFLGVVLGLMVIGVASLWGFDLARSRVHKHPRLEQFVKRVGEVVGGLGAVGALALAGFIIFGGIVKSCSGPHSCTASAHRFGDC